MGSKRDKRKKRSGGGKAHSDAQAKAAKSEEKQKRRQDDEDIDAILAQQERNANEGKPEVLRNAGAPSPARSACAFTALPGQGKAKDELVLHGGEAVDEHGLVKVFSELFRLRPDTGEWTVIRGKGCPSSRSGHQLVCFDRSLYLFGGEFTAPKQGKFHHFRDLWRFDPSANEWEQFESDRRSPSARSGHRMAVCNRHILLFGGYYDTGEELKYFNDLWSFDPATRSWQPLGKPSPGSGPSPRSGCSIAVHNGVLHIFGGYKVVQEDDEERGRALMDAWRKRVEGELGEWERLPEGGIKPSERSGFGLAQHKKKVVLFGGSVDRAAGKRGDVIVSEFLNELYGYNLESCKWFPMPVTGGSDATLRYVKPLKDMSPEERAATKIQSAYRGYATRKAMRLYKEQGKVSEMIYAPAEQRRATKALPSPVGRIKACLAVLGNTLYMYGGMVEVGDAEYALDDLWRLDLNKLDRWDCVHPLSVSLPQSHAAPPDDDDTESSESDESSS